MSRVAVVAPRASASATRSSVSSGHLICTKWTSRGVDDAGVLHRRLDGAGDEIDLFEPAEMFEGQGGGARAAERQRAAFGRALDIAPFEHDDMGRKRAFGAARHDDADRLRLGGRQMALQQVLQRAAGEAAGEIIDAAVAFGLAEDRDDVRAP